MKSLSCKLGILELEDRRVLSTVATGDLNGDGLMDMAAITAPNTVTVSLGTASGGYTVAAVLTTPSNRPMTDVFIYDYNGDGKQDVIGSGTVGNNQYSYRWAGDGNGSFGPLNTFRYHFNPNTFDGF
jgi:hypothetical protein